MVAYSALTRVRGTQDLEGVLIADATDFDPSANIQDFVGVAQFTGQFSDTWLGLSYAHALGSRFGVGLTGYAAFRNQWRRSETLTQIVAPKPKPATASPVISPFLSGNHLTQTEMGTT